MGSGPGLWALDCHHVASMGFVNEEQAEVIGRPAEMAGDRGLWKAKALSRWRL